MWRTRNKSNLSSDIVLRKINLNWRTFVFAIELSKWDWSVCPVRQLIVSFVRFPISIMQTTAKSERTSQSKIATFVFSPTGHCKKWRNENVFNAWKSIIDANTNENMKTSSNGNNVGNKFEWHLKKRIACAKKKQNWCLDAKVQWRSRRIGKNLESHKIAKWAKRAQTYTQWGPSGPLYCFIIRCVFSPSHL